MRRRQFRFHGKQDAHTGLCAARHRRTFFLNGVIGATGMRVCTGAPIYWGEPSYHRPVSLLLALHCRGPQTLVESSVHMNTDQLQGSMKSIVGRLQEDFGVFVGSTDQQVLGIRKQVSGRAERRIGDIKELLGQANALAIKVRNHPLSTARLVK